jgi:peptidoglycan/LPS O-acetylase OafA/YrhL
MSSKNSTGKIGVKYISSIDGLRAIAVTAVVLYHLGISWIPGGFLGVDLFFVISGYVITRLILDSINQSSALDLRAFYAARLRTNLSRFSIYGYLHHYFYWRMGAGGD